MSAATDCPGRRGEDTVARWVAEALAPDEAERFEVHLLACDACQASVRQASALRAALRGGVVQPARGRVRRWALPLAIAAALATVWLARPGDTLSRLADPGPAPEFDALRVRAVTSGAGVADRGMQAYSAGDYAAAARLLDSAATLDPTSGTRFFLGVSRLKADDARAAAVALGPVARDSTSPYAGEAGIWLAKAWLHAGLPDSALAVLANLARGQGNTPSGVHAAALADSITEAR